MAYRVGVIRRLKPASTVVRGAGACYVPDVNALNFVVGLYAVHALDALCRPVQQGRQIDDGTLRPDLVKLIVDVQIRGDPPLHVPVELIQQLEISTEYVCLHTIV